jgi:hypothetical protein
VRGSTGPRWAEATGKEAGNVAALPFGRGTRSLCHSQCRSRTNPKKSKMLARRSNNHGGWVACCLAFLLKLLAFLQAFVVVSTLLYVVWILSHWARHHHIHFYDLAPDLWFPSAYGRDGVLIVEEFDKNYIFYHLY